MTKLEELVYKLGAVETKIEAAETQRESMIVSFGEIKLLLQALNVTVVRMESTNTVNHQTNVHNIDNLKKALDRLEPIVTVHEQERLQGKGRLALLWGAMTIAGSAAVTGLIHWISGRS